MSIKYPRKCEYCDYEANNPTMYHYHKKFTNRYPLALNAGKGVAKMLLIEILKESTLVPSPYMNARLI